MKFNKSLIAATAITMFAGAAQAALETGTLEVGGSYASNGYTFSDLSGSGTLEFSKLLITALNLASVGTQAVPAATLQISTSTNASGAVKYVSVAAAAPVTGLTSTFDGATVTVTAVQTQGGSLQTTVKNSATNGTGSLSISDLKVDLTTKTIYADIVGANGVGTLNDYALWTYDTISGPTTFDLTPGAPASAGSSTLSSTNTLSGLFLVKSTDIDAIFVKSLNLNNTGRSGINAVNNRTATNTAGFGSITSKISVIATPIPEPSTYALMAAGLVGLGLFGRRRAAR
jgi:hypothetical protein